MMDFKVSDIEYSRVQHTPLDGEAVTVQGGIAAATFTCTCGHTWRDTATASSLKPGQFALTSSSITVNCPNADCNLQWKALQGEDY
jgi:hypothetical protein